MGIDRIAMLKYGIPDLRAFFESRPALAAPLRLLGARDCRRSPEGSDDEIHPVLAQGASRHRRDARRGRRDTLTMLGLEVEGLDRSGRSPGASSWPTCKSRPCSIPTPTSCGVCKVDTGSGRSSGRVRRAQRAHRHEGRLRAARHLIPGTGITLKAGTIRGVESERHAVLGARAASSPTIMTASSTCRPTRRGQSARRALGLDDPVIEIKVTPNRPDCLGVHGIARDLAARASAR
jgi:phenylalanyl-tRNA synthetase beta chain